MTGNAALKVANTFARMSLLIHLMTNVQ